jgi:hypothetical protein
VTAPGPDVTDLASERSARDLAVHVCSRDRPDRVAVLLHDLARVLGDGIAASVTVYDDSSTARGRASYRDVCRSAPLAVRYFGEKDRRVLIASARHALGADRDLFATGRPLGEGGWDLAGCRFTAMLHGAVHPRPTTLHLFLDDDLRLVDCRYRDQVFTVDGASLRRHLGGAEVPTDRLFAAGVPYCGRADVALLEHLDALLDAGRAGEAAPPSSDITVPDLTFPAMATAGPYVHPDSPGISGGFLLTNRLSLRALPLFRSYNEDWIWLRQLALAGGTIHRFDAPVVHAGDRRFALSLPILLGQFEGEVFDGAWRRCGEAATPADACHWYVEDAYDECSRRVDATWRRAAAQGLDDVVDLLGQLRGAVREAPRDTFRDRLRRHVERSWRWERAFAGLEDPPVAMAEAGLAYDARPGIS